MGHSLARTCRAATFIGSPTHHSIGHPMSLELIATDTKLTAEDLAIVEAMCLVTGVSKSEFLRGIIQTALQLEINKARIIDEALRAKGFSSGIRR